MLDVRLYLLQRISALVMVPLALGHIATMIYAIQDGLSAEEILGRTSGSVFWGTFYGLFVVSVSIHGAIGLRVITHETLGLRGGALRGLTWATGLVLFGMGLYAVYAVVAA